MVDALGRPPLPHTERPWRSESRGAGDRGRRLDLPQRVSSACWSSCWRSTAPCGGAPPR